MCKDNQAPREDARPAKGAAWLYVIAAAAILIASLVVDGFNATEGWMFFTYLSIGYIISRGLAKSGSREPYRADR